MGNATEGKRRDAFLFGNLSNIMSVALFLHLGYYQEVKTGMEIVFITAIIQETTPLLVMANTGTIANDFFRLDGLDNFLYHFSQVLLLWFRKKINGCKHGLRFK